MDEDAPRIYMCEHKISMLYGIVAIAESRYMEVGFLARKIVDVSAPCMCISTCRRSFKNTGGLVLLRPAIDIWAGCCIDRMKILAGSPLLMPTSPNIE